MIFIDYSESVSSDTQTCCTNDTILQNTQQQIKHQNTQNTQNQNLINIPMVVKLPEVPRIIPIEPNNTIIPKPVKKKKREKFLHSCLLCCISCILCCGGAQDYIAEEE